VQLKVIATLQHNYIEQYNWLKSNEFQQKTFHRCI